MAKLKPPVNTFRRFAFLLSVGDQTHGLTHAEATVHGLILGRAHQVGKPSIMALFQELGASEIEIEIVLMSREDGDPNRRIVYALNLEEEAAFHLAIDLDNCQDRIAFDRVLFPAARLLRVIG